MSNTFIDPTMVARDASLALADELIVGNLVSRATEAQFAQKVGETIEVIVPPTLTASELATGGSTSAATITETKTDVTIEKHFYVRADLTSKELLCSVDDFNEIVTMPSVRALVAKADDFILRRVSGGFARHLVGTVANQPSTHAHILAGEKKIFDNKGKVRDLVSVITSTTHASLAQLNIMTSADYGADRPNGLATNSLGKVANISFFRSPEAGQFDRGYLTGTILTNGDPGTGSTIAIDGFTAATGTIYEGTRFTIADDSSGNVYTVTADSTIAGNAVTLPVTPAADASIVDGKAITFNAAHYDNIIWAPQAVAAAILPGPAIGPQTGVVNVGGIGVRIISNVDMSSLSGVWVFDCFVGAKVVQPAFGSVFCG